MRSKVLIVEDDDVVRRAVGSALEDEGFAVVEVASGEAGLDQLLRIGADAVLLDVRLPGMGGFEVLRRIRAHSAVPVVIVSALADSHDVVAGLEAGADDYVTKPFVVKELTARLRAHLRRAGGDGAGAAERDADRMCFGEIEIRSAAAEVLVAGEPVALTATEFRLLAELARNAGQVLSREQLLERIWGYDYFGDTRIVDAHIGRLRAKVEATSADPLIVTVRGLGYKLAREP